MNKDRSYFVFLEALEKPGCPICHLVIEDSRGYLDSLMYERVLDVPTRLDLMDSFGFCSWHAWQIPALPAICNPIVGFSIFASDILRKFDLLAHATINRDQEKQPWQLWLKKVLRKVKLSSRMKGKACPTCVHVAQAEYYYLRELTDFIQDEHFLSAYEASERICLPHFFSLEQRFSNQPYYPALLKLQLRKVQSLRNTIDEFIRKQDHRFRDEIASSEAKAWRIAMEFLAGKPGVFNNEMEHDFFRKSRDAPISDREVAPIWSAHSIGFQELIYEMKTAKQITLSLKKPLPADLFRKLQQMAQQRPKGTMDVAVEELDDVEYLRGLHAAGFSLFYGIGLPTKSIIFLDRQHGFVLEERQQDVNWNLRVLKNPEDLYLSLLWHRFGIAVLFSGLVKAVDPKRGLFCLTIDNRREQWCRFKDPTAHQLPAVGAKVEIFGWQKWSAGMLEILHVDVLESFAA
jgi:hypothetical protein